MHQRGFTLIELVIVIAIMGVIMAIATLNWNQLQTKTRIESQIRQVYADLMEIRLQALYSKRSRCVVVNGTQFRVYSSVVTSVAPVTVKTYHFPMLWNGASTMVTFDAQGLMNGTERSLCVVPNSDTTVVNSAAVDSIVISQARINLGKRTGGDCRSANIEQK